MASYDDLIPTSSSPDSTAVTNYDDLVPAPVASQASTPTASASEAAGRGFANSASFGIGKWVNGIVGATLNRVVPPNQQGDVTSAITSSTPVTGGGFWADVTNSVEGQKAQNEIAMQEHPYAYVAGAAAPAVVGGLAGATKTVAMGAVPTTWSGATATGAALGAEGGLADSTTGKQAVANTATGAVLGGVLSGAATGITKLVTTIGAKSALSTLDSTIEDAQSENESKSTAALAKLHSLFASSAVPNPTEAELLEAAQNTRYAIANQVKTRSGENVSTSQTGATVKALAPSGAQLGMEALKTAAAAGLEAGGVYAGHQIGGVPGAIIGAAPGIWAGRNAVPEFLSDVGQWGAMKAAGSPFIQKGSQIVSPLVGGTAPNDTGLTGILGNYISNVWSGH